MTDVTKVDLEKRKLQAEIDKLIAEAAEAEAAAREHTAEAQRSEYLVIEKQRQHEHSYAANSYHRTLDFAEEVRVQSVEAAMDVLGRWARQSSDPITIRFTSPGGSVLHGLALYDFITSIRDSGVHITTVNLGYAASMAGVLLQAGNKRVVGVNSWILVHEISTASWGKLSEVEDEAAFAKQLNQQCFDILAERSTLSAKALLARAHRKDFWVPANDALKLGLADSIGYK